jgi:hypothetical protein
MMILRIKCLVCGYVWKRKSTTGDVGHFLDSLVEPLRCHGCGEQDRLEAEVLSDGR